MGRLLKKAVRRASRKHVRASPRRAARKSSGLDFPILDQPESRKGRTAEDEIIARNEDAYLHGPEAL